jgi:hypothetical protein
MALGVWNARQSSPTVMIQWIGSREKQLEETMHFTIKLRVFLVEWE